MKVREIGSIYYHMYGSSRTYKPRAKTSNNFAEILDEKIMAKRNADDTPDSRGQIPVLIGGVRIARGSLR